MVNVGDADFFAATKKGIDFQWIYYGWTGIEAELREALEANDVPFEEVSGREKSPYSIWCKMQAKNVAVCQVQAIQARSGMGPS